MAYAVGAAAVVSALGQGWAGYTEGQANSKIFKAETALGERMAAAEEAEIQRRTRYAVSDKQADLGASGIAARSKSNLAAIRRVIEEGELDIASLRVSSEMHSINKRYAAKFSRISGGAAIAAAISSAGGYMAQLSAQKHTYKTGSQGKKTGPDPAPAKKQGTPASFGN